MTTPEQEPDWVQQNTEKLEPVGMDYAVNGYENYSDLEDGPDEDYPDSDGVL